MGSNNGSSGHSGGNSGSTGTTPSTPNNPGNGSGLTDNNGNLITSPLIPLSGHTSFLLTPTTAHKSWLNNTNNLEDKNNIFDYLSEQNYSNESLIFIRAMLDEIINNSNNNNNDWLSTIVLLNNSGPKITNILHYLECINLNQSAVFTMYVDQPTQNQSDSWSGTPTDPNVGHTFIAIKQNNIRRVLGFYPSSGVNPFTNPSTSSSLIDDSGHSFHTSISVSISPAKLQTIIAYISNYSSTYNLNTYNCTDFGLSLSKLAGINIPSAKGTWPGGSGNNPGQLGQNIRKIPLPTGSSLKNTTGGNSPLNQGNCN